jgi:hypothetical protein
MKKLLITGNVLLFVLLLMAYTGKKGEVKDEGVNNIQLGIDPQLSRQLIVEYRDDVWRTRNVNGAVGKDARSVWFSLDKLKAFIAGIERKAGNSCNQQDMLGVRIYYAAYPDSIMTKKKGWDSYLQNHQLPMEYVNHHTVLLVPTIYNNVDGHNYDFDPRFRIANAPNNCSFAAVKDVMGALLSSGSNSTPGISFTADSLVQDKRAYMIMPDNMNNRRWKFGYELMSRNTGKGGGSTDEDSYLPPPSDFTNGGTLIPPPYPEPEGGGTGNKSATSSNMGTAKLFQRKIHVPSSGASYMRWVDNTNDTGWVNKPLEMKEASIEIKKFQ